MKKEELIIYKEKLSKLTKEEKKLRDLELRKYATGELQGPPTGYPSIDKPWLKYHDKRGITDTPNIINIYKDLYEQNKDQMNQTAIIYFGAKITFRELFKNVDKTAQALKANGIKKGDFVTICAAGTPEVLYMFYALAKIGAVSNFMSPFFDKEQMLDRISDCNSKMIVVMDSFYENVKDTIKSSNIEKTILLPTLNSFPLGLMEKKIKTSNEKEILWNDFIKEGKNEIVPKTVEIEKQMPLVLVYSSGTTGASKAILLTHDGFCNTAFAYPRCSVKVVRGGTYYQIVPPWFSTGISTSIHLTLVQGGTLFMDPRFDRKVFVSNMLKYNFTGTLASVTLFQAFMDEELLDKKGSLSNLTGAFQGGEKEELQDKRGVEKVFKNYGAKSPLLNGYGQCECGAGFTTQTRFTPSNTTAGVPIPGVKIGIFDKEHNELPYNTRGEIYACTPCGMKEYYNNQKATEEYFYYDLAGDKWSRTGDIGIININGELEVQGRAIDYSMINDKKIYNFDIEDVVLKNENIQNCDVFTDYEDDLVCHIILKKKVKNIDEIELIKELQKNIYEKYDDIDYVPNKFKFRESFPIANFSKKDTKSMKAEKDGFIIIDKNYLTNVKKLVK